MTMTTLKAFVCGSYVGLLAAVGGTILYNYFVKNNEKNKNDIKIIDCYINDETVEFKGKLTESVLNAGYCQEILRYNMDEKKFNHIDIDYKSIDQYINYYLKIIGSANPNNVFYAVMIKRGDQQLQIRFKTTDFKKFCDYVKIYYINDME